MPEIRPPEHFVKQQRERVRVLAQFGVHFARIRLTVAFEGRTAPPESPDESRSFGPEHAGRKEGFPAKKRA
ncbi:hypothetical protein AAFF_G00426000 [Aldrovandia affinis]|uniref:Uncharacterized protein n=1 Tax=Aldrovandia affinis TaxID=143900 RepID=A0AAD7X0C8_9TELE|nr:hypothetical protein AAFF_G00426000 [Aldrovandia affinis]